MTPQGAGLQTIIDQLNSMMKEVNAMLGQLGPDGTVLVAYQIKAFRANLSVAGGIVADINWITRPPVCLQMTPREEGPATPCMKPATHVWEQSYVCSDHAPEGAKAITEILAELKTRAAAGEAETPQ